MKPWHCLLWGCFLSQAIALPSAAQVVSDGTTDTTVNSTDDGTRIDKVANLLLLVKAGWHQIPSR